MSFATILTSLRAHVAALAPQTVGDASDAFTHTDGLLALAADAPTLDRLFEVTTEGSGATEEHLFTDQRRVRRSLAIRLRYDSRQDLASLEQRMVEDEEQIADTIEGATATLGCDLVTFTGSIIDRGSPHFPLAILTFDCLYTRATF